MQFNSHIISAFTGVFLLSAVVPCVAQTATNDQSRQIRKLQAQVVKQQRQYATLAKNLTESKGNEAQLRDEIKELKLKFNAAGENLLTGGQGALLDAYKNAEVLDKQNLAIQEAASKLTVSLQEYLQTVSAADPDARVKLETSRRELDVALRIRQNPRPQVAFGNLQYAKVVSIDAESGMLVINAGENQAVRRGMTFSILRGNRKVAEAIVAETRDDFSGLLPTEYDDKTEQLRLGDTASIKTT